MTTGTTLSLNATAPKKELSVKYVKQVESAERRKQIEDARSLVDRKWLAEKERNKELDEVIDQGESIYSLTTFLKGMSKKYQVR